MANKELDAVLAALEKVFSGEVAYDEALMDLGQHAAQVRKNYPNLFAALSGSANSALVDSTTKLFRSHSVSVEDSEPEEITYSYTDWSKELVHRSQVDDEFLLRWDVAGVAMFASSATLTLRGASRRTRFTVTQTISEDTFRVKIVAILPV